MSDVDTMELAWGVDIEPVITMVSIAFGKRYNSSLNVTPSPYAWYNFPPMLMNYTVVWEHSFKI